jgi:hypothetical protein
VEQVGPGVVLAQSLPPARLHAHRHLLALAQVALGDRHPVHDELAAAVERVLDRALPLASHHEAGVALLAARLRVRGGTVEDDLHGLALPCFPPPLPVGHQGQDARGRGERAVAEELRLGELGREPLVDRDVGIAAVARPERRLGAGALALRLHLGVEDPVRFRGDPPARVLEHFLRQIGREPVRVVEREQEASIDHRRGRAGGATIDLLLDAGHAEIEGLREALLFLAHRLGHPRLRLADLRIRVAHQRHHAAGHVPEERRLEAQHPPVAHGPPHDPPQHVAAPLVGRGHPVGDQEGGRARVVRDDPHRDVGLLVPPVGLAAQRLDPRDQGPEQIGVVVRLLALQHRGHPLEPHAGVDRRLRQRRHLAARVAIELHEHEVPDLEPAVAVAGRALADPSRLLLRARQVVTLVEVHLRAGPAGAGVAHGPEVVLLAQAQDAVLAEAGHRLPEREGVVVVREDGGLQAVLGQPQLLGQQFPAEADRVFLEVVAEGKVAQHLEERVVPRGPPDVLEVVVLASRPDALLGGGGPDVLAALLPQEDGLELHHARVREQERGVLDRHEGGRAHHGVAAAAEIVEESRADLAPGHRSDIMTHREGECE